ncbi:MAG: HU family DNA-binding protein [Proteobacteria bacterium]|nr:HU family DNA-binding protein [Pseudomonadota bacterium]
MTKAELVESVARSTGLSGRAAADAVEATIRQIARALKKEKRVSVAGLGTFSVRVRKARKGRNPRTGEDLIIKAGKTVGFRAAPGLKKGL